MVSFSLRVSGARLRSLLALRSETVRALCPTGNEVTAQTHRALGRPAAVRSKGQDSADGQGDQGCAPPGSATQTCVRSGISVPQPPNPKPPTLNPIPHTRLHLSPKPQPPHPEAQTPNLKLQILHLKDGTGDSGHLLNPLPRGTPAWIKTLSNWQAKQAARKRAAARSQGRCPRLSRVSALCEGARVACGACMACAVCVACVARMACQVASALTRKCPRVVLDTSVQPQRKGTNLGGVKFFDAELGGIKLSLLAWSLLVCGSEGRKGWG